MKRTQFLAGLICWGIAIILCHYAFALVTDNDLAEGSLPRTRSEYIYIIDATDSLTSASCSSVLNGAGIYDSDEVSTSITTGITQPDTPRSLRYLIHDASAPTTETLRAIVSVTGTDIFGKTIIETVDIEETDKADDSTSFTAYGVYAFSSITSISVVMLNDATGDKLFIGQGNRIGFPVRVGATGDVFKASFNGTNETVGTVNATYSTYTPTGTLDGSDALILWIRSTYKGYNTSD